MFQGQRNRELPCNPAFFDFLSSELLSWSHGLYNLAADPRQTVVGGSSFGGLAAACAGLQHSETFGNVLSQSGSFHWLPPGDQSPDSGTDSEPNWVARQFIASPKLQLRFYIAAGSEEFDVSGDGRSILVTTRTLRDVLLSKGYEVHFQQFAGGHDYLSWRGTLADGLIALNCANGHSLGLGAGSRTEALTACSVRSRSIWVAGRRAAILRQPRSA